MRKHKSTGQKTPTKINQLYKAISLNEYIQDLYSSFISKYGRNPNYILIHPTNKCNLYNYSNQYYTSEISGRITTILGMKIIWTADIAEYGIILTFG